MTKHFMSFEWNDREVQRYNLFQNLSPVIYWHFISNQFFPLKTFDLAQNFEEHFEEQIRQKMLNREIPEQEYLSLYNIDNFRERVKMVKEKYLTEQLLETSVIPMMNEKESVEINEEPKPENDSETLEKENVEVAQEQSENKETEKENEIQESEHVDKKSEADEDKAADEIVEDKPKDNVNTTDGLISFCTRHLDRVKKKNNKFVTELSEKLQNTYDSNARRAHEVSLYEKWAETGKRPDGIHLWNLHDIYDNTNFKIYFDVAAKYLEDCQVHLPDYLAKQKNVLMDSWYCTKMEEEYLHYVAKKHQEKNEKNFIHLMQRINDVQRELQRNTHADGNALVKSHPLTTSFLNELRQKEEDAKCNICGSGDYEESDLIVF